MAVVASAAKRRALLLKPSPHRRKMLHTPVQTKTHGSSQLKRENSAVWADFSRFWSRSFIRIFKRDLLSRHKFNGRELAREREKASMTVSRSRLEWNRGEIPGLSIFKRSGFRGPRNFRYFTRATFSFNTRVFLIYSMLGSRYNGIQASVSGEIFYETGAKIRKLLIETHSVKKINWKTKKKKISHHVQKHTNHNFQTSREQKMTKFRRRTARERATGIHHQNVPPKKGTNKK